MSDNEAEHEGNPPGVLVGAKEQPVIAELLICPAKHSTGY